MKVLKITDEYIMFDNASKITFDHNDDGCEYNYADFLQVEDELLGAEFDENLIFEEVTDAGFRFGSHPLRMVFVPCYSKQSGWYTHNVDIYYNGNKVLSVWSECIEC